MITNSPTPAYISNFLNELFDANDIDALFGLMVNTTIPVSKDAAEKLKEEMEKDSDKYTPYLSALGIVMNYPEQMNTPNSPLRKIFFDLHAGMPY